MTVLIDFMISGNDVKLVSSSSTVRPNPVPTAACMSEVHAATAVAKGILVHCNNKKSVNTNRVSFDVSSSSSMSTASTVGTPSSSSPLLPARCRANNDGDRPRRRSPDDGQRTPLPPISQQQLPSHLSPAPHRPPPSPYSVQDGRRTAGFGVKSYIHEFYDDPVEDRFHSFQVYINTRLVYIPLSLGFFYTQTGNGDRKIRSINLNVINKRYIYRKYKYIF